MHTHHTQLPLIPHCFLIDVSASENRRTSQLQVPLASHHLPWDKNAKPASLMVARLSATGWWKHLSQIKVLVFYRESQVHHLLSHLGKKQQLLEVHFGLSTRKRGYLLSICQRVPPRPSEHFLYAKKLQDLVFSLTMQPQKLCFTDGNTKV